MDVSNFIKTSFKETSSLITDSIPIVSKPIERLANEIVNCFSNGGKVVLCGNGGSAADCQHIAAEFVVKLSKPRNAMSAIALTTDTSILTAAANDFSFDYIFARQIDAICGRDDVLIAISTSGNSDNIMEAVRIATSKDMLTAAFLGGDGGKTANIVDIPIVIPHSSSQKVQEVHITMGHTLVEIIETMIA